MQSADDRITAINMNAEGLPSSGDALSSFVPLTLLDLTALGLDSNSLTAAIGHLQQLTSLNFLCGNCISATIPPAMDN